MLYKYGIYRSKSNIKINLYIHKNKKFAEQQYIQKTRRAGGFFAAPKFSDPKIWKINFSEEIQVLRKGYP